MNLTEEQKKQVSDWIGQGLKLSEIQDRLESEFGIRSTYLDVRLLVDDLKLMPKDQEAAQPKSPLLEREAAGKGAPPGAQGPARPAEEPQPGGAPGGVSVSVDSLARPGALVSGRVTFSDGNTAEWYLDQTGRLGVLPTQQGYRPSPTDLQEFQMELQSELQKLGF